MMRTASWVAAAVTGFVMLTAQQVAAQASHDHQSAWSDRLTVAARFGVLAPTGGSELFTLLDQALTPGHTGLRPRMFGAEVRLQVRSRWAVLGGIESGGRTVSSISRVQPVASVGTVPQETRFDVTSAQSLGVQWQAWRWRDRHAPGEDRLRLMLGAGGGVAHYALRQWGSFVDAERGVRFDDDFRSSGRGGIGYASAALEVPVGTWVAVQGEVRRQMGSAPMRADYAGFDRLDLGGTRLALGVLVTPRAFWR
jgi:hypothetical protein